ncbi:MAG TPA: hypothetical protein VH370_22235 [Humisphaera sp.]|jgi:hypothetical protein|nr:hypothetical protein [Humisphaera sp.]
MLAHRTSAHGRLHPSGPGHGQLFINGRHVGNVELTSIDGNWHFGRFHPQADFGQFAERFGRWSLLMHAEDDTRRLSREAARELRALESAIDLLHASLKFENGINREIRELNIDGTLIEWWEQ